MNKLVILFLLLSCTLSAQKKRSDKELKKFEEKSLKYFKTVFGEDDKSFNISKAPNKWKDKAAVVLFQKIHIAFLRNTFTDKNSTRGIIRKKILLQDKSAIEDFAEYFFQPSDAGGIKIIKANGEKLTVDLKKAIKVETEVPDRYKDDFHSENFYKIAIPNLEVGDIIDYFKVFTQDYSNNIELIATLNSSIPILSQQIIFDVDKHWTFYYNSINDAPEFVQDKKGGIDLKGRRRKIVKRFVLNDSNRPAEQKERWKPRFKTEPCIKIMAIQQNGFMANKKEPIQKTLDPKDVLKSGISTFKLYIQSFQKNVENELDGKSIKKMNAQNRVETIYRGMRLAFLKLNISKENLNLIEDGFTESLSHYYYEIRSEIFAGTFVKLLDKYELDSDYVIATPKYYGTLDEVTTLKEIIFGVYVPETKEYYWPFDNYLSPGSSIEGIDGTKALTIHQEKLGRRKGVFQNVDLPKSDYKKNIITNNIDVSIEDKTTSFACNLTFEGSFKKSYSPKILYHTEYMLDEILFLKNKKDGKSLLDKKKKKKKNPNKQLKKTLKSYDELNDDKSEIIENFISEDFKVDKFETYSINKNGVENKSSPLELSYSFSSDQYITKAGPNLFLNIGELIGGQVELSDTELEKRRYSAELNFAKSIVNNINITLPEGLIAHGLEDLKINVDNSIGSFISTVTQEGQTLKISTSKIYKNEIVSAEEWSNLVKMLEAAYDFTQKKLVLKQK